MKRLIAVLTFCGIMAMPLAAGRGQCNGRGPGRGQCNGRGPGRGMGKGKQQCCGQCDQKQQGQGCRRGAGPAAAQPQK